MKHKKLAIFITTILLCATICLALAAEQWLTITNTGKIIIVYPSPPAGGGPAPPPPELKLAVYNDSACTVPLTAIDWGTMENGTFKDYFIWIRNEGDLNASIQFYAQDFVPSVSENYLTVEEWYETINVTTTTINVNEVLEVMITLVVLSNATEGDFSFNILIYATEA